MATKKNGSDAAEVIEIIEEKKPTAKKTTSKKTTTKKDEEIQETPVKVSEAPKKERKPRTKKSEAVEAEVKEEKAEVKQAEIVKTENNSSFLLQVISSNGIYSFRGPGLDFPKNKLIPNGAKIHITEVKGSWGKISEGKWILLGATTIKI